MYGWYLLTAYHVTQKMSSLCITWCILLYFSKIFTINLLGTLVNFEKEITTQETAENISGYPFLGFNSKGKENTYKIFFSWYFFFFFVVNFESWHYVWNTTSIKWSKRDHFEIIFDHFLTYIGWYLNHKFCSKNFHPPPVVQSPIVRIYDVMNG